MTSHLSPSPMSSYDDNSRLPIVPILAILAVLVGGYFAYRHFFAPSPVAEAPQMPPAQVRVHEVTITDVPLTFEYAGRTNGSREVEIRARVSGILLERTYVEGQTVKQGDVLFVIDPAPFKVALQQAEARYVQARNDWNRAQQLYKQQAISARERDQARANHDQTKAEVDAARINLGYTTVTAPISGVTSQESLSEGSLVTADSSLLTRLTQLDPMYVNFSAPDTEVLDQRQMIAEGRNLLPEDGILRAEIHFGNGSVYPLEGEINFTDSIIDPETGTVSNRAVVPNPDGLIMPGQFVRVVVKGMVRKDAIAVPDRAIMQGPQGAFVYVVNEQGIAEMRPVQLGMVTGNMRLIVSGLQQGDRVIYEGMIKVRPNAPVTIMPQAGEAMPVEPEAATGENAAHDMIQPVDLPADETVTEEAVTDETVTDEPAAASGYVSGLTGETVPLAAGHDDGHVTQNEAVHDENAEEQEDNPYAFQPEQNQPSDNNNE